VYAEVELRMLDGSEFQTVEGKTAMLKPQEAKVVRTVGTNSNK